MPDGSRIPSWLSMMGVCNADYTATVHALDVFTGDADVVRAE
jgi:hypothetical protein